MDRYTLELVGIIERVGWAVQGVSGGGNSFCYTVGLSESNLPELFLDGMPPQQGQAILNAVATRLRAGETITPGEPPLHLVGYPVTFRLRGPVDSAAAEANTARRLYGDIILWQILWPDREGRFPGDPGYDQATFPQRLIKEVL